MGKAEVFNLLAYLVKLSGKFQRVGGRNYKVKCWGGGGFTRRRYRLGLHAWLARLRCFQYNSVFLPLYQVFIGARETEEKQRREDREEVKLGKSSLLSPRPPCFCAKTEFVNIRMVERGGTLENDGGSGLGVWGCGVQSNGPWALQVISQ